MPVAVVDRSDARFASLKKGHNLRFPASDTEAVNRILFPTNTSECAAILQQIIDAGVRPTIRSGGHCYEDFVVNNPLGAMIDLSLLDSVGRDTSAGPYVISPGAVLGSVYQSLYKRFGVTLPAGTCYRVGAGGHISGGGYGLLSRLFGLTVDWVSAVDLLTVDKDGRVQTLRVNGDHPELLRACRGAGGGNFGVITSFRFDRLPTAPQEVAQATLSIPWSSLTEESFTKLLILYGQYWEGRGQDRDTWGLSVVLTMGPRKSNGHINLDAQFCNHDGTARDLSVLHEFFSRFQEFQTNASAPARPLTANGNPAAPGGTPVNAAGPLPVRRLPWLEAALSESSGSNVRAKYKSSYMKKTFTVAECSAFFKMLGSPEAQGFVVAIDGYGGAINSPERGRDTAIVQRSSVMKLQWQFYWEDERDDARHLKFMDELYTAVYTGPHVPAQFQGTPFGSRYEGCYMNYADADMLRYSFWPQLFYGDGYPMLQQAKRRYDPHNIFHSSMSVRA